MKIQLRTMDHSVRRSMKNAANCVKYGELQGSRNRYMSNAYGASIFMMEARLSEGLLNGINHLLREHESGSLRGLGIHHAWCFPLDEYKSWNWLKRHTSSLDCELSSECRPSRASLLVATSREPCSTDSLHFWTSDQARLPAKFKHII